MTPRERFLRYITYYTTSDDFSETAPSTERQKELIRELKKSNPDVEKCLFRALGNVHLDTMIGYKTGGVRHSFLEDYDK